MAHVHPAVEFKDSLGFRAIEQVFIQGQLDKKAVQKRYGIKRTGRLECVILPAFNRILGGIALNSLVKDEYIGPLLANKVLDVDNCDAYMLDGTLLGRIKALKIG